MRGILLTASLILTTLTFFPLTNAQSSLFENMNIESNPSSDADLDNPFHASFESSDDQVLWVQTANLDESIQALAEGIAVDDSGLYIVGSDHLPALKDYLKDYEWRIEKRNRNDGSIIWSLTENIDPFVRFYSGDESALAVTVDNSGLYIVGTYDKEDYGARYRIEKRNL